MFSTNQYAHPQVHGLDPTVIVLEHSGGHRVEVWPASGFNAFRWVVPGPDDMPLELLYADPGLFSDGRPTRSGIPVLFPFPNRIASGTFNWAGQTWTLPLNDSTKHNAIHGFACRRPWPIVGRGLSDTSAWVTGQYHSRDHTDDWPAAHQLTLTLRLSVDSLRLEAEVANPDTKPLPFGLGYHPYLALPFAPGMDAADCLVQVPAGSVWNLKDSIPTGKVLPVDPARDLTGPRRYGDLQLDDILTSLAADKAGKLRRCGQVMGFPGLVLEVLADENFRDVVVFTPAHRRAFCIEPYTCPTDAVNLTGRGIACGWRALAPGAVARFIVELRLHRGATIQTGSEARS
jgi:aldose 1-epimerase